MVVRSISLKFHTDTDIDIKSSFYTNQYPKFIPILIISDDIGTDIGIGGQLLHCIKVLNSSHLTCPGTVEHTDVALRTLPTCSKIKLFLAVATVLKNCVGWNNLLSKIVLFKGSYNHFVWAA